jgi:hypothetical protein
MSKSAMQELIENYYKLETIDEFINWFSVNEKKLLVKEKEQIIDAYYGNIDGVFGYREEGEEYYNQTYNQNK